MIIVIILAGKIIMALFSLMLGGGFDESIGVFLLL